MNEWASSVSGSLIEADGRFTGLCRHQVLLACFIHCKASPQLCAGHVKFAPCILNILSCRTTRSMQVLWFLIACRSVWVWHYLWWLHPIFLPKPSLVCLGGLSYHISDFPAVFAAPSLYLPCSLNSTNYFERIVSQTSRLFCKAETLLLHLNVFTLSYVRSSSVSTVSVEVRWGPNKCDTRISVSGSSRI